MLNYVFFFYFWWWLFDSFLLRRLDIILNEFICQGYSLNLFQKSFTKIYLLSAETPEPPITIIGVAGTPVHLPCNITPEDEDDIDDAIALVLWYKDEATTPIYSLDARQGTLDQARHAAKDELGTRARLSISERPAVLKLDPALIEDEGEYKCRADFKKARTRYMAVYLKVVGECTCLL